MHGYGNFSMDIATATRNDYYDYLEGLGVSTHTWTVAEAKARFSEVLEKAQREGRQRITKRGKTVAYVVPSAEVERRTERKGNLAEFLMSSPLRGSGIKIEKLRMRLRKAEL